MFRMTELPLNENTVHAIGALEQKPQVSYKVYRRSQATRFKKCQMRWSNLQMKKMYQHLHFLESRLLSDPDGTKSKKKLAGRHKWSFARLYSK